MLHISIQHSKPGDPQQYSLIDLQGTLDGIAELSKNVGVLSYKNVCKSLLLNAQSIPHLAIGHHILQGRVVKLKKALTIVLRDKSTQRMNIVGKVTVKLLFDIRGEIYISETHGMNGYSTNIKAGLGSIIKHQRAV